MNSNWHKAESFVPATVIFKDNMSDVKRAKLSWHWPTSLGFIKWEVTPDKCMNANTMVTRVIITHQHSFSCLWDFLHVYSGKHITIKRAALKLQVTGAKTTSVWVCCFHSFQLRSASLNWFKQCKGRFQSSNGQICALLKKKQKKNTLMSSRLKMSLIFCGSLYKLKQIFDVGSGSHPINWFPC